MLILQQWSLPNFPHPLKKKKTNENLAFEHQTLFPKRGFSFSTRSTRNIVVSHSSASPTKQPQNPTTPGYKMLPKPPPLIKRRGEHFAQEAMKTLPVVQNLQIKLRDKELPQGPSLRRPRRCPTGPSRLRAPRAPQHGPRRGAAALLSLRRAGPDNAPLLARRDFASPPSGREPALPLLSPPNSLGPSPALLAGDGGAGPQIPRGPGRVGSAKGACR